jgi:hypothetical protein
MRRMLTSAALRTVTSEMMFSFISCHIVGHLKEQVTHSVSEATLLAQW